ncbi:transglutaminase family protein [Phragmitibacter flavus]|uniref:Transglutaminase family protein n=1 Tax=Phragmitibacter flavus TaxID=2576071 RepID=A0A5R8KB10_9BACT|nr:transglutaminase family protein [Phragmitibacter flavus]TLD69496.1 transglutaminase family protein [Phragmitibacter flavus]
MIYEISHRTTYVYDEPVSISHHMARLSPRAMDTQRCLEHEVTIEPPPTDRAGHVDYFGNPALFFAIRGAHRRLTVTARSKVEVNVGGWIDHAKSESWEVLQQRCRMDRLTEDVMAGEFSFPSRLIYPSEEFAAYARISFQPGRSMLKAALDLNTRINKEFAFDPAATDVATPVDEAFKKRRGVCQDFAHVLIACVRSLGLPAKYVSGYLETLPPPGKVKLVGADASHAWVSVWCGTQLGWVDLDPTNNCIPGTRHITVAHGRDFRDVSPLRGIVIGEGSHELSVAVDVNAVPT